MPEGGRPSARPVLFAFLVVTALTVTPYVRAALAPPPGTAFVGSFYFTNDVYHYLSYVEQAEGGAFLFRSKLTLEPHAPALVNLEWWLAGRLSALLGRRPMLGWRLLGVPAALALLWLADRWLRRAGLPDTHRLPALLLVALGAGAGGLLYWLGWTRRINPVDLSTGLFPFLEMLTNPHFVVGTVLVCGALLALERGGRRATALGVALTFLAGLVRPYDLVLIVLARAVAVALTEPLRRWVPLLLPFLALVPVVAYNYWVFYLNPAFRVLSAPSYPVPFAAALAIAVAPALVLAALALPVPAPDEGARRARAHLWAWIAAAILVIAARPVSYSLQFLVGIGVPLLALGAIALSRRPAWVTLAALALLSSTPLVALWIVTRNDPRWFVPASRKQAASGLRTACRPSDIALAPPDVGLWAIGLSPCSSFVSHPVMPDFNRRTTEAREFYTQWQPAVRAGFLEFHCIAALALPEDAGDSPAGWLGPATPFRRVAAGPGYGIYRRDVAPGCRPRWPT